MVHAFWMASAAAWLIIIAAARLRRGKLFAIFASILVGIHMLISSVVVAQLGEGSRLFWVAALLQAAVAVHYLMLSRPRMRSLAYRIFVSVPASYFAASTLLALPWAVASAFVTPRGLFIPYLLGLVGIVESFIARREEVDLLVDRAPVDGLRRYAPFPSGTGERAERPLRIVQITDPHLGPFMSVDRLRGFCERAVAKDPDLVLLTGDFLTMESQDSPEHLARAFAPLAALRGRVFACHGNHDHEAPAYVAEALRRCGARLLVDEAVVTETPAGPVQIVGMDFHFRGREERMAEVCARNPRVPGALRLVLLHNPGAFKDLPEGEGDLVLAGHTHGGQLGLLRLGAPWTLLRLFADMPDHGLWARGRDRLYVHRGTGHYGFPLRLGVPAEESLVRVHVAA